MAGRGGFNSRIGFIMAAVGSAVGLGNLWRFPYETSTNGGAAFLVVYLVLLFLIGLPALFAELSLGRHRRSSVMDAFEMDRGGRSYKWVGVLFMVTAVLLLSYYSVIAGWAIRYMVDSATAPYFDGASDYLLSISSSPMAIVYHAIFMILVMAILVRGVGKGIEKANLIMMPFLFLFVLGLVVYGVVEMIRTGDYGGLDFYLLNVDWSQAIQPSTLNAAAGQTFFSIGLGLGTMLTYASYIGRDADLQNTGFTIGFADTGVAVLAGFMTFPIIFVLGLDALVVGPDALSSTGGGLFIGVPTVFATIGGVGGGLLAFGFFLMLTFAALSSALSLLEVPVSVLVDRKPEWGRPRAVILIGLITYILGIPAAIDPNGWLGFADGIVNNILLLAGGLLLTVYVGWVRPDILQEFSVGRTGFDWGKIFRPVIKYPLPVLLAVLLSLGIYTFFAG